MVTRGNLATGEQKQEIFDFMAGSWKKQDRGGIRTILVSEGNESLKMEDGIARVVYVQTFFELDYSTGKMPAKKAYKHLPL